MHCCICCVGVHLDAGAANIWKWMIDRKQSNADISALLQAMLRWQEAKLMLNGTDLNAWEVLPCELMGYFAGMQRHKALIHMVRSAFQRAKGQLVPRTPVDRGDQQVTKTVESSCFACLSI